MKPIKCISVQPKYNKRKSKSEGKSKRKRRLSPLSNFQETLAIPAPWKL